MFGDCGVDKRFSESLQLRQRAFLVGTNQAAITGDIRRQDSRQSPLYGLAAQDAPPAREAVSIIAASWATVRPGPMSELGQKRRSDSRPFASGLPRLSDVLDVGRHFAKVPEADITSLHSITSSARASSVGEMVRPSALASGKTAQFRAMPHKDHRYGIQLVDSDVLEDALRSIKEFSGRVENLKKEISSLASGS